MEATIYTKVTESGEITTLFFAILLTSVRANHVDLGRAGGFGGREGDSKGGGGVFVEQ